MAPKTKTGAQNDVNIPQKSNSAKTKKRSKKCCAFCCSIILVIAVLTSIFLANRYSFKTSKDICHITLTAPTDMSKHDFETSAQIIKQMAKIFSSSGKYAVEIENN